MNSEQVKIGSRWTHKNKHMHYTVVLFTNQYTTNAEKHPVTVIYLGDNGNLWSRPLDTWFDNMVSLETKDE